MSSLRRIENEPLPIMGLSHCWPVSCAPVNHNRAHRSEPHVLCGAGRVHGCWSCASRDEESTIVEIATQLRRTDFLLVTP